MHLRVLKTLHTKLVRSKQEYAATIWSPYSNLQINQVEKDQRTTACWACRGWRNTSGVGEMKRYKKISKLVKESPENSHRTYVDNIFNTSISENPKKFYSYIKQKKSGQSNIPVLKTQGKLVSEPAEVAEAISPSSRENRLETFQI